MPDAPAQSRPLTGPAGQDGFAQAVLDSMAAQVCVLDPSGTIVATNRAWERFARDNGCDDASAVGVGVDYIAACIATGEQDGAAVARGVRDVLSGSVGLFELEYPCHSPTEQRWFRVAVTPFDATALDADHAPGTLGCVVTHVNISERKLGEQEVGRLVKEIDREHARLDELISNVPA